MKVIELNSLKLSLELLGLRGLHPQHHSLRASVISTYFAIGTITIIPFVFVNLYQLRDLDNMVASFDTITSFTQMNTKLICVMYFKKELFDLMNKVDNFWDSEPLIEDDEYTKERIKIIEMVSAFFCLCYRNGGVLLFFLYASRGIMHRRLPFAGWTFNASPLFEIAWVLQLCLVMDTIVFVVGFDALVSSLLGRIAIQFRLLSKFITKNFNAAKGNEMLLKQHFKEVVDYHSFLLGVCKDFEKIFTHIFLLQFLLSTSTLCLSLFITSESDLIGMKIGYGFYICQAFLELGCYCFPPTLVATESENVVNAIYGVNWEDWKDPSIKRNVIRVIEQCQKPIIFTAGGWVPLNNNLYVSVFNSAISFYTLMVNKKEK